MACVTQGILPSQCFCNVNLGNYELPYVPQIVTP